MKRYHKKVYFPSDSDKRLKTFTDKINTQKWLYTRHSIDSLKWRSYNIKDILLYIKDYIFNTSEVFEYYAKDTGEIIKACFRIPYSDNIDLIPIIDYDKELVTIYSNLKNDNHITLKKELYAKG